MAVLQQDIDLDGGVAAAVENFAADDGDDGGHGSMGGRVARLAEVTPERMWGPLSPEASKAKAVSACRLCD